MLAAQKAKIKQKENLELNIAKSLLGIAHTKRSISLRADLPSHKLLDTIYDPFRPLPLPRDDSPSVTRPWTRRDTPPIHLNLFLPRENPSRRNRNQRESPARRNPNEAETGGTQQGRSP
jgi:hypothetical protein